MIAAGALLCLLCAQIGGATAEEDNAQAQASREAPQPQAPGLDLQAAPAASNRSPVLKRWWFWTAVGAVVAGTVAVIVASSRGSAPPPTNLGNQAFRP